MVANTTAVAATVPVLPAAPIIAPLARIITLSAYEPTLAMGTETIGALLSLHPRPNHSNIRALEQDLFDKLQAIQSVQSDEWG